MCFRALGLVALYALLVACDASYFEFPSQEAQNAPGGAAHVHDPLFGGVLHEVGDHAAHLELLFDAQTGTLSVYVLDAHATGVVKIPEEEIVVRFKESEPSSPERPERLRLVPEETLLADERPGRAAAFYGSAKGLRQLERFEGYVETPLTIRGHTFAEIPLRYPEGTEPSEGQ